MKLSDFENGLCPSSEVKGWRHNQQGHEQVKAWIDAGYLFEPGAKEASALLGHLWLTETGRVKAGLGPVEVVVKKPVQPVKSETQRGFAFDD